MNAAENFGRRFWSCLKERLVQLRSLLIWVFDFVCCCGCFYDEDNDDIEKGNNVIQEQKPSTNTMSASGQVHKVIMVGSGGVGKSALTLQFMYDEVSF